MRAFPPQRLAANAAFRTRYRSLQARSLARSRQALFWLQSGRYVFAGGGKGVFLVRNPSRNSAPMLRTTFKTSGKAVEGARLYITWIGKALSDNGHSDLAYRILHNNQYPSLLYAIDPVDDGLFAGHSAG